MFNIFYIIIGFIILISNNIHENQESNTPIAQENVITYTVTQVAFFDDDGYNDELFVVLGNKELFLTIRWYTGVFFSVGDQVTIFRHADSPYITINGNSYAPENANFYILK
jgi:hypothetical protein